MTDKSKKRTIRSPEDKLIILKRHLLKCLYYENPGRKDRFRQGLGHVVESYLEVARRLGVPELC